MPSLSESNRDCKRLCKLIESLRETLASTQGGLVAQKPDNGVASRFVKQSGLLVADLRSLREKISPIRLGHIGITLGRSDSIAKFFAFSFISQDKQRLDNLKDNPFFGSGVYAIYYHGSSEDSYQPFSGTETPIYVGKADPDDSEAETAEEQGMKLFGRLKEHVKSINGTNNLVLGDFFYRAVPIQSGMQAAVEDFMIRLFRPVWNKEVKICYGIGKHGDSASTRRNKRSPWDTMHPGRGWAAGTSEDQMSRASITAKIAEHFASHSPVQDKNALFEKLALK